MPFSRAVFFTITFLAAFAPHAEASDATARLYGGLATPPDPYLKKIEPTLVGRCVVCHSCTEAPCQLKLGSFKGVERGLKPEFIASSHIKAYLPSRLTDEPNVAAWRARGYADVLNRASPGESILYRSIALGLRNEPGKFDLSALDVYSQKSNPVCPTTTAAHDAFAAANPNAGMPLGLPALDQSEFTAIQAWITAGSPGPTAAAAQALEAPVNHSPIDAWETFLNRAGAKEQLIARYVYEHSATVHVAFREARGDFYELVRSRTASPAAISELATETPNDSVEGAFHYRFRKVTEAVVKKTHVVWQVGNEDLSEIDKLFHSLSWEPKKIASHSGNPFDDFREIPAEMRSKFMLHYSRLMIDMMVRGTVCVGSSATYAIRDHFWVAFLKPGSDPSVAFPINHSPEYSAESIKQYQDEFETNLRALKPSGLGLDDIWYGNGNPNARITVFRHNITSSVHHGWVGGRAPTTWVLSYGNFERLYYNLVVNYKYWGKLTHRMATWDTMREVRKEGEELFTTMLPAALRSKVRREWNKGTMLQVMGDYEQRSMFRGSQVSISDTAHPVDDLLAQLVQRYPRSPVELDDRLNRGEGSPAAAPAKVTSLAEFEAGLRGLTNRHDLSFEQYLPSVSYLRLRIGGQVKFYSLLASRAVTKHEFAIKEGDNRRPDEDDLVAFEGLVSSHPGQIFDISLEDSTAFLNGLRTLSSETAFETLKSRHAVRRNSAGFWKFYDDMMKWSYKADPINAGLIDLSRFDKDPE